MEYLIIIALQIIGIAFHVGQKVKEIDARSANDSIKEVLGVFFREDVITLALSGVVLFFNIIAHYVIGAYSDLPQEISYYMLYSFGIALILGYTGQSILYKAFGRAEQVINKKIEDKVK